MLCLTHSTDPRWVHLALENLDAVLVDHAHCEMKAATNALSLAVRAAHKPAVVTRLVALAEEELAHFRRVYAELERRGVPLGSPPPDDYAAELRKLARASAGTRRDPTSALLDRLLVAALIEARSCERFRLLARALAERGPPDLARLYGDLLGSEAKHFAVFVDLARQVAAPDASRADARLSELASIEGELSARLAGSPSIHG
jgi:tRNA 2-(methylsulfanyl)-N6-isopentenyladenosine37 hydroxylase